MCHHYSTGTGKNYTCTGTGKNYTTACKCFDPYELCCDGFTCQTSKRIEEITYDTHQNCEAGQIGITDKYESKCYWISAEKLNFYSAMKSCKLRGGSLATIKSRKTWYILASHVNNGKSSFWVDQSSEAEMFVFGEGSGRVVNPAEDMSGYINPLNYKPPQMDNVDGCQEHIYICEFSVLN